MQLQATAVGKLTGTLIKRIYCFNKSLFNDIVLYNMKHCTKFSTSIDNHTFLSCKNDEYGANLVQSKTQH